MAKKKKKKTYEPFDLNKTVDNILRIARENYDENKKLSKQDKEMVDGVICDKIYLVNKEKRRNCIVIKKPYRTNCMKTNCKEGILKKIVLVYMKNNKATESIAYACDKCKRIHIDYSLYDKVSVYLNCVNPDELNKFLLMEKKAKKTNKSTVHHMVEKESKPKISKTSMRSKGKPVLTYEEALAPDAFMKKTSEVVLPVLKSTEEKKSRKSNITKVDNEIEVTHDSINPEKRGFEHLRHSVILKSFLECSNSEHRIDVFETRMSYIDEKGKIRGVSIKLGYCMNCDLYYMQQDTYKKIKKMGICLCRIYDEDTYFDNEGDILGISVAKKSLLRLYGYSANKSEKLTEKARHKLLKVLIKENILSVAQVENHLSMLMLGKEGVAKYKDALSKWKNDYKYVLELKRSFANIHK